MGKATKWIANFLFGKNEHEKRADRCITWPGTPKAVPRVKRRWSFGRSNGNKEKIIHRVSKSVDSIDPVGLTVPCEGLASGSEPLPLIRLVDVENTAATKIQAVFRAYLARRALWALKGLVKLQALARGFLVRKQTSAAMRSIHALMSIQVRARARRVQMAEETDPVILNRRRSVHRKSAQDNGNLRAPEKAMGIADDQDIDQVPKSRSGYFDVPRFKRGDTTYYSGNPKPSDLEQMFEDHYLSPSSHNMPGIRYSSISKAKSMRGFCTSFEHSDIFDAFVPHYMANTESSRAKAIRSQSAPKQRPHWSMPKKSNQKIEARMENDNPWFVKMYRSRMVNKDAESDSTSTVTSQSNLNASLLAYEPHLIMY